MGFRCGREGTESVNTEDCYEKIFLGRRAKNRAAGCRHLCMLREGFILVDFHDVNEQWMVIEKTFTFVSLLTVIHRRGRQVGKGLHILLNHYCLFALPVFDLNSYNKL